MRTLARVAATIAVVLFGQSDGRAIAQSASSRQAAPQRAAAEGGPVLLTGAWIIDGTGAPAVENGSIRVEGGRIAAVGSGTPPAAGGARVIDLKGKTVVPGLSDMHVHLGSLPQAKWMLKLLLAHGVTNVKETGGTLGNLAAIRGWMPSDPVLPHLYVSGVTMNGSEADLQFINAGRRLDAVLTDNLAFGADFLKIHNWVSSFALKRIASFAKEHDVYLTGHVPLGMNTVSAIDAGLTILEHVRVQPYEILDDPLTIAAYPLDQVVMRRTGAWAFLKPGGRALERTLAAWEQRKDKFFIDPTLVVQEGLAYADSPSKRDSAQLALVSPAMRQSWPNTMKVYGDLSPEEYKNARGSVEGMTTFIGLAHKRGVRVLTGTDTPVPYHRSRRQPDPRARAIRKGRPVAGRDHSRVHRPGGGRVTEPRAWPHQAGPGGRPRGGQRQRRREHRGHAPDRAGDPRRTSASAQYAAGRRREARGRRPSP